MKAPIAIAWFMSMVALAGACSPLSHDRGAHLDDPLHVRVVPDGALDAAPAILRIVVRGRGVAPDDVYLIDGEVGPHQLGQLARGEPSLALSERILPSLRWREGEEVVLAPTVRLAPGRSYAVAVGSARESHPLTVIEHDPVPWLRLVWPPEGVGHGHLSAVWCGEQPLPPLSTWARFAPRDGEIEISSGASPSRIGASCVHAELPPLDVGVVPPPALLGPLGQAAVRLEPIELRSDGEPSPPSEPLLCPLGQLPVGGACIADIADDRLRLRTPSGDRLWLLADGRQLDWVRATSGEALVVHPLVPGTPTDLRWATVDVLGRHEGGVARVFTRPPMAHVVITEVHANPLGPEPDQEFVELYNDGLAPAELGDFVLEDVGGRTPLPSGIVLMPGAFALVVNQSYDATSDYDPAPIQGTLIVRVEKLGKGGLRNDGEPLALSTVDGVVSRFPPVPKPRSGESVQRLHPRVSVDEGDGFVRAVPTPGRAYEVAEGPPS